jgi:ribonuclease VapC
MIVDASALIAILNREAGYRELVLALAEGAPMIPAPALTAFFAITGSHSETAARRAEELVRTLRRSGVEVAPFEERHAAITRRARESYGQGGAKGGALTLTDLMVYAVAKDQAAPILCVGPAFAKTDALIHPASRTA